MGGRSGNVRRPSWCAFSLSFFLWLRWGVVVIVGGGDNVGGGVGVLVSLLRRGVVVLVRWFVGGGRILALGNSSCTPNARCTRC